MDAGVLVLITRECIYQYINRSELSNKDFIAHACITNW